METAIVTGHPDRPFVMGGLYHGEHTPPFASDGGLRTGTKTHSTTGGSADNYNELSFLDAKDAEEIKLQAERDQRLIVKNNRTTRVGYDELNSIGHDLTIEADVMMEIKVGASRVVLKPDNLTVESASILIHGNTTKLNPGNAAKAKSKGASVKPDTTPKANFVGPAPSVATPTAPPSTPSAALQESRNKLSDLLKVAVTPFAVLIGGLLYSPSVADGTLPKLTVEETGIVKDEQGNTVGYMGANSQLEPLTEQDEVNYRTYRANGGKAGVNEWITEKPLSIKESSLKSDKKNLGITNPNIKKLSRPKIPEGMTQSQFGKELITWGQGPEPALTRTETITKSDVFEMQSKGLTREMVEEWRDFYKNDYMRNNNNITAKNREHLMNKILKMY